VTMATLLCAAMVRSPVSWCLGKLCSSLSGCARSESTPRGVMVA